MAAVTVCSDFGVQENKTSILPRSHYFLWAHYGMCGKYPSIKWNSITTFLCGSLRYQSQTHLSQIQHRQGQALSLDFEPCSQGSGLRLATLFDQADLTVASVPFLLPSSWPSHRPLVPVHLDSFPVFSLWVPSSLRINAPRFQLAETSLHC